MTSHEPMGFRDIARKLRAQIISGELSPGQRMLSETDLAQTYGVAKETARRAMRLLRSEGLVVGERGFAARVRREFERRLMKVPRGSAWIARMPTPDEVKRLGVPEGVPVVELTLPSGEVRVLRGDENRFTNS
jgi:GntR family transcriptional regulator